VDAPPRNRLSPIRFLDMAATTAGRYLVKGLIPADGLTVIWGPPKSGKSFWATDLLLHVALGRPWRGHKITAGPVIYVAAEGGSGFGGRIEAFRRHHDLPPDADPPFYTIPARVELIGDCEMLIGKIRAALDGAEPVAVAIDTLNRTLDGSENDPADMGAYIQAADAIREELQCAIVLVHHCGIEGSRPRGHTSLTGAADAQIAVNRTADKLIRSTVEWQKDGPGEGDITTSQLHVVDVGTDEDGEPVTSCVLIEAEPPVSAASDREPKLTPNQKTMLEMLQDAMPHGLSVEDWNAQAREAGIGTKRKADHADHRRALDRKRLIHTSGGRFYITPKPE